MKHRFASKIVVLSVLLALMFSVVGVKPAQAAGPFSHTEVAIMARDLLPPSELKTLLNDYRGNLLAGSVFPDWGYSVDLVHEGDVYDYYAEIAHLPHFATAYLNYIRRTYSPPYSDQAKKDIAFLFGIISHQVADPPFHYGFLPFAQAIDTTLIGGVPGHSDVELGVDVFNLFDRGCWDNNPVIGCRYKWDNVDWYLPTNAIMAAYAELFANGVSANSLTEESQLLNGWTTFHDRSTAMVDSATQGYTYYTLRLPNTHANYYAYGNGGMTNMAALTAAKWEETWNILGYSGPYHVKPVATGTGDCFSWDNACTLQTALNLPYYGGNDIWVMQGVYKPTNGTDRTATFQLRYGRPVYGGFAGAETARDQRDPAANLTILSGDVLGDDSGFTNNAENSYHVVTGATGATLDGFTVTAGNANGASWPDGRATGGGMLNYQSSPTVANVIFSGNSAEAGGGMMNYDQSSPTVTNVTFSGNLATSTGGGMNNYSNSNPTLTNVTFSGNSAQEGGGMINNNSSPTVTNATFNNNTGTIQGGGLYNYSNSNATLTNVTFSGNNAALGGGLYNWNCSNVTLTNVTFSGNTATNGGGIASHWSNLSLTNVTVTETISGGGILNDFSTNAQIRNAILWGNTGGQVINQNSGTAAVSDSVVQDGYAGGTNIITTDPILGTLGNHGGFTQTIPLQVGSSAIDAGNDATCATTDQRGVTRPQYAHCDIGAFEFDNYLPTDIAISASSVNENQPVGTTVGTLTTTDPDAGDTHTYSLTCATPGADDASFTIAGNALNTAAIFDYETKASNAICIRTDDGNGGTFDKDFTITVNNVIETVSVIIRSTGTQDGWLLESGENTNVGGTMDVAGAYLRLGDDAARKQYRSLLSFATGAALPDTAVITKVTLKVRRQAILGGGNPVTMFQGFMADVRRGPFGASTLQLTDWQATAHKTFGPFNTAVAGGWYTIDLTAAKAYVNKLATLSGLTQLRLRFKLDDNNNAIANFLSLYSGNAAAASRPQLIIEYYIP